MERWTANKLGLFNFWYYDDEQFELSNGKIIFRGTNGSGKSVTTQSFIPLLLDGDKRPSRIDPFGSNARKIENYILVSEEDDDRISYLYMEFVKPQSNNYITIGMGLRGRKGKTLESWYFILKDGRRVNHEFKLYNYSGQKYPLTAKQLENGLGSGNIFTKSQKEYMERVNEHLFGYSDIDSYKDLLNLLIQLRSPKLSKDFKPTVIYDILKQSLNTLSDDDLRPMAEAMDNMDSLNLRLEELKSSISATNRIKKIFDIYNMNILYDKADRYNSKKLQVKKLTKSLNEKKQELEMLYKSIDDKRVSLEKMNDELTKARVKEESLRGNKGFELRDEITKEEKSLNEITIEIKDVEEKYNKKYNLKLEKDKDLKELENKIYKKNKDLIEKLDDEEYYKNEAYFLHTENLTDIIKNNMEYDFKNLIDSIEEYDKAVRIAYDLISSYESIGRDLNEFEEKHDIQQGIVRTKENILNESKEYLTNIKSEFIEKINKYISNLKEFIITEDDLVKLFKEINEIYELSDCTKIDYFLNNVSEKLKSEINASKLHKEIDLKKINEEIIVIDNDINELINNREAVEEDKSITTIKSMLDENSIPYEDFYKTIDFKENIQETERKIIEGNLYNMGILTSLIVPSEYKESTLKLLNGYTYKIIFSDNKCEEENISNSFKLEDSEFNNKFGEEVRKVLSSISLNKLNSNNTYISYGGEFEIGIISGFSDNKYNLKYIGINSRENYRKQKIEELQCLKQDKIKIKDIYESEITSLDERVTILEKEKDEFPKTEDIESGIRVIDENIANLNSENKELSFIKNKLDKIKKEYSEVKLKLFDATQGINIPKNKKSYEEAMASIIEYRRTVNSIKDLYNEICFNHKEVDSIKEYIEDITNDMDNINGDLFKLKDKSKEKVNELKALNEAIKSFDLGNLEEEYKIVTEIINDFPKEIQKLSNTIVEYETTSKHNEKEISLKEDNLNGEMDELGYLEEVLRDEIKLNYISEISNKEIELKDVVSWILKNCDKSQKSNEDILSMLYDTFNSNKGYLIDYHPRVESIFTSEKTEDERKNKVYKDAVRQDIKIKFNKKEISLYKLLVYLETTLEEQNLLINDKEREVFEDTLINTLSSKINAKIYKARAWVKEIDELMKSMNTSSGFKLYLSWKPKKAESENEIDIKELTEILSTPHFMTEDQRQSVADHFKEKLKEQKRIAGKDGLARNYHTIIKDVLDYREWFEFQLSFSKPTERKKELTDNEFFKLSGGEKAMAMYVPLFAAVNARYNGTDKKDAPRIISLDEAFAGVDEDNISNMFELIEQLKLDYILNSQVLWGTYESVKSLSIYELIRQGDEVVLPIKYHWDGKAKTIEMDV